MDPICISLLHSKYPISYNKNVSLIFAIYRSNVNTSLKNKICFENIYFPSKFIKLCPESLKEHTDTISLRSDEKHFIEVSNICPTITLKLSQRPNIPM